MSTSTDEDVVRDLLRRAVEQGPPGAGGGRRGVGFGPVARRARGLRRRRRTVQLATGAVAAAGVIGLVAPLRHLTAPATGSATDPVAPSFAASAGADPGQLSVPGLTLTVVSALLLVAATGAVARWAGRRWLRHRAAAGRAPSRRTAWAVWSSTAAVVLVALLTASTLARAFVAQVYVQPSPSMERTLAVGDRFVVEPIDGPGSVRRGDVVVLRAPAGWLPDQPSASEGWRSTLRDVARFTGLAVQNGPGSGQYLIKRVIGLPGDRVHCCDSEHRLAVNGAAVDEAYLRGEPASATTFDVTVPAGQIWVLGDNRAESADSRMHRDVGGGGVPLDAVVGRAVAVVWPLNRFGGVVTPR
jgi:signal peptidase I